MQIGEIYSKTDETSKNNADEDNSSFAQIETIEWAINQREHLEEGIVNSICEGSIDVGEQDGGILNHNLKWFDNSIDGNCRWSESFPVNFALRTDLVIS